MSSERTAVREIVWREVCPWLLLFRTLRLSLRLPVLLLGTLAAVLIPVGWRGAGYIFLGDASVAESFRLDDWYRYRNAWPAELLDQLDGPTPAESLGHGIETAVTSSPCWLLYREGIEPFVRLVKLPQFELRPWAYLLAGAIWTLIIWGWLGGAINRIAMVRLGCEQGVGVREALRFSRKRLRSYVLAPLVPLGGVALACLAASLAGLLLRADFGTTLVGLGWIAVLLLGFVIVVLLAGTGFGWPLMWGAISAEPDGDEFEAFNRSFSFALGKPLNYLCYALLVIVIGTMGSFVVDTIMRSTIAAGRWSASWGTGAPRWNALEAELDGVPDDEATADPSTMRSAGLAMIRVSEEFVRTLAMGFRHSFFWCAAAGIYLLLRRDADETEFDDLYLEDLEPEPGLPPMPVDDGTAEEGS